jgi:hypothetical protein
MNCLGINHAIVDKVSRATNCDFASQFETLVKMRKRIMHSLQMIDEEDKQNLATPILRTNFQNGDMRGSLCIRAHNPLI